MDIKIVLAFPIPHLRKIPTAKQRNIFLADLRCLISILIRILFLSKFLFSFRFGEKECEVIREAGEITVDLKEI